MKAPKQFKDNPAWPRALLNVQQQCEKLGCGKTRLHAQACDDTTFPQNYKPPLHGRTVRSSVELNTWLLDNLVTAPIESEQFNKLRERGLQK